MRKRTNPTCTEDFPKAEPSSPFRMKNERPSSKETSVCGLNNGKVTRIETNAFSACKYNQYFSII